MSCSRVALICCGLFFINSPMAVLSQTVVSPASSASAGSSPVSATRTTALPANAQKWGEGILELEFLHKLRVFLETDPFDFTAFERTFGIALELSPPNSPHADGSWGVGDIRVTAPFGRAYGNRSRGGVKWNFIPSLNSSYVAMEFVKTPLAGKRDDDGLPCLTMDHFMEVFRAPRWSSEHSVLRYTEGVAVYGSRQFKTVSANGVAVKFNPNPGGGCSPNLSINFDRLPAHPGVVRPKP